MNPSPNLRLQTPQIEYSPLPEGWPGAGVYQLWIRLNRNARITVGRLGRFVFPAGVYVYTGRASRALRARVLRHAKGGNKKHWHIDYLLDHRYVRLVRVGLVSVDPETECELNQAVGASGRCVVRGFGSSDCGRGCETHLWLLGDLEGSPRVELSLSRGGNRGQKGGRDQEK